MQNIEIDAFTLIQLIVSFIAGIIGCSVLWSISADSTGGVPAKEDGAHHAFNYVVSATLVALVCNVIVVLFENKYLRFFHFFALGIACYLISGIGPGDAILSSYGFLEDNSATCTISHLSNKCIPINPISFTSMTLLRIKVKADEDLSEGDKKAFTGGVFCWTSLIVGMLTPLHYKVDDKLVVVKVIFWVGGLIMAGIGIVTLGTTDVAVSPHTGNQVSTSFRASMQIIGLTLFLSLTSSMAFFTSDHHVAKFTAALAGALGFFMPVATFLTVVVADDFFGASDDDITKIRTGGIFCWLSALAHTVACCLVVAGEDCGDKEVTSVSRPTATAF